MSERSVDDLPVGGDPLLPTHDAALLPNRPVAMSEDASDRNVLWLWTWVFVAVSSAGYAVVNLMGSTPGEARGGSGLLRFLVEVALPIAMCAGAVWFGVDAWRSEYGNE